MSTVESSFARGPLLLLICIAGTASPALAHPVSQGALQVILSSEGVTVLATVSVEEVQVAAAASGRDGCSPLEVFRNHGDYLLAHFKVAADGTPLVGEVLERPTQVSARPSYTLRYPFGSRDAPARIVLSQDVLREFEFAPGNRWEGSYLVRIGHEGRLPPELLLLTCRKPIEFECSWSDDPKSAPEPVAAHAGIQTGLGFFRHGIAHILTGYDHLLFVVALLLGVRGFWDLIKIVSAFTLAHTVTLTLSAFEVVRLPETLVESMIAGSIVVVATRNIVQPHRGRDTVLVVFLFGLFHGLGFAGAVLESIAGLGATGAAVAISSFAAGVEVGHQIVIIPAFAALACIRKWDAASVSPGRRFNRCGSAVILAFGVFYLVTVFR